LQRWETAGTPTVAACAGESKSRPDNHFEAGTSQESILANPTKATPAVNRTAAVPLREPLGRSPDDLAKAAGVSVFAIRSFPHDRTVADSRAKTLIHRMFRDAGVRFQAPEGPILAFGCRSISASLLVVEKSHMAGVRSTREKLAAIS